MPLHAFALLLMATPFAAASRHRHDITPPPLRRFRRSQIFDAFAFAIISMITISLFFRLDTARFLSPFSLLRRQPHFRAAAAIASFLQRHRCDAHADIFPRRRRCSPLPAAAACRFSRAVRCFSLARVFRSFLSISRCRRLSLSPAASAYAAIIFVIFAFH